MAASVDARMVAWVDGESINAGGLRLGQAASSMGGATALSSRGGVRPSGGEPGLIAALPTPGMKVRVTPGIFVLPSASPTGGEYRIALETQTDLDVDNSGSFPRTDLVIAEVVDTGTSSATAQVRVLKGPTDSPGAARPTNTTPNAHYIVLGSVDVRVGAESSGNIRTQDVHPERTWAVAAGGVVPFRDQAEQDGAAGYDGLVGARLDTGVIVRRHNGAWGPSSDMPRTGRVALPGAKVTTGTDITSAFEVTHPLDFDVVLTVLGAAGFSSVIAGVGVHLVKVSGGGGAMVQSDVPTVYAPAGEYVTVARSGRIENVPGGTSVTVKAQATASTGDPGGSYFRGDLLWTAVPRP